MQVNLYNGRKMVGWLLLLLVPSLCAIFFMTMKSLLCGYLRV